MSWMTVLKSPLYADIDENPQLDVKRLEQDARYDKYLSNPMFSNKKNPFTFQSNDGNARGKFSLGTDNDGNAIWTLNLFEIANTHRGKGLARKYLKELVSDIREVEDDPNFNLHEDRPLDIVATQSLMEIEFWDKMIREGIIQGQDGSPI